MEKYLLSEQEKSDEEILLASIHNPTLFVSIVQKYQKPFIRKAYNILKDHEDAADVVQEAFTKIYLNASRFKKQDGAQFSSWAYRILINVALTQYQKRKRRGQMTVGLSDDIWTLLPDKNLDQFDKKELTDEIASVLSRMSPVFAKVLTLFCVEGRSQEEIAKIEGVSIGAVKTRVHRAKHAFRKIYKTVGSI